jgi:hypothetical protein
MTPTPIHRPDVILAASLIGSAGAVVLITNEGDFVITAIGGFWQTTGAVPAFFTVKVNGVGIWGNLTGGSSSEPQPIYVPNPYFVMRAGQAVRVDVVQDATDLLSITIGGYWLVV